jgi:hypothetical protein
MQIVVWVLAVCILLGLAAVIASLIDSRAGWSRIPLELDESPELEEVEPHVLRRS